MNMETTIQRQDGKRNSSFLASERTSVMRRGDAYANLHVTWDMVGAMTIARGFLSRWNDFNAEIPN